MGVLIGVRVANFVANELRNNISQKILWNDFQCVTLAENNKSIVKFC